jgi:hypothetical protein
MADREQIHAAMYPGSLGGDLFSEQTEVNIRQHALESACFVVNATAWLDAESASPDHAGHRLPHRPDIQRLLYRGRLAGR